MSMLTSPGVPYTPTPTKTPTPANYVSGDYFDYTNQYLPDTEKITYDRFGNQMITGMLERLGKESSFTSDDFKWSEEGRLTQLGTGVTRSANVFTLNGHTFRAGETIVAYDVTGAYERKGRIASVTTNTFTALCGNAAGWTLLGTADITLYAFGTEFKKGTSGMDEGLNSQVVIYENTPVNIKETVKETGSNLAQRTWIDTGKGFIWYYKNYNDTEKRFKNKCESELILGERWAGDLATDGYQGTQGLYSAMKEGNIFGGPISDLSDVDEVVERMNAQGMLNLQYFYTKTSQGAIISDFLKAEMVTALSWGAFNNDENMALNLGFKGFQRSGYEFSISSSRFLDDPLGQGAVIGASKVHGLMIPSGSKKVYDKTNSTAASLPILHLKYRKSELTDRKFKMTVTGAEAGNSRVDELVTDFLSERMLVVTGRNQCLIAQG